MACSTTYPTGAVVNYTWNTPSSPNGLITFPDNNGNQTGCMYEYYGPWSCSGR